MSTKPRIESILIANCLGATVTGIPSFDLSDLKLKSEFDFQYPTNVRLGHIAERIVAELIKLSTNYRMLYENTQLIDDKRTIGEIDFIIEDMDSNQLIHMELAYKFYLFDPGISNKPINNWIGPNRNDSLIQKLEKLKKKQFPLLYHTLAKSYFDEIEISTVSQKLCLLVSLFVPYAYKAKLSSTYEKAIKGYYLNLETFNSLNSENSGKTYYIPPKKEWGMEPSENESWAGFKAIEELIRTSIKEKQSPLVWQKCGDSYLAFFIVWW